MSWPSTNVLRSNAYSAFQSLENLILDFKGKINVAGDPPLTKALTDFIADESSTQDEKDFFQAALNVCTAITSEITSQGL